MGVELIDSTQARTSPQAIDFYGKSMGKYTVHPMDLSWIGNNRHFPSRQLASPQAIQETAVDVRSSRRLQRKPPHRSLEVFQLPASRLGVGMILKKANVGFKQNRVHQKEVRVFFDDWQI